MIIRDIDLNSEAWRKLVFQGKNQKYGAYYLRRTSTRRHLWALGIVIGLTVASLLSFLLIDFIQSGYSDDEELRPVDLSKMIMLQEMTQEVQAVPVEKPQLKEAIQFTPPQVVTEEDITKAQEELTETIASSENTGPDSISVSESTLEQESLTHEKTAQNLKETATTPDSIPEFPGGQTALLRFIYQNIQYPPAASKQRIQGKVICSFIVNEDGSVSDVKLEKGVYIFLDEEALRVIKAMPVWKPAMKKGKAIKVKYYMPVEFRLPMY